MLKISKIEPDEAIIFFEQRWLKNYCFSFMSFGAKGGRSFLSQVWTCENVAPASLLHRLLTTPSIHSFTPDGSQMITPPPKYQKTRNLKKFGFCRKPRVISVVMGVGSKCRDPGTHSSEPPFTPASSSLRDPAGFPAWQLIFRSKWHLRLFLLLHNGAGWPSIGEKLERKSVFHQSPL